MKPSQLHHSRPLPFLILRAMLETCLGQQPLVILGNILLLMPKIKRDLWICFDEFRVESKIGTSQHSDMNDKTILTSSHVILCFGSQVRNLFIKSIPDSVSMLTGNFCLNVAYGYSMNFIFWGAGSLLYPGHIFSFGVPKMGNIE